MPEKFPLAEESSENVAERSISPGEQKEKKKISKIHFLIHPGFIHCGNFLLNKYIAKAKELGGEEIMVAFSPSLDMYNSRRRETETLKKDIKNERRYTKTLMQLKSILGNRLIVLTGYGFTEDEKSAKVFLETIKKLLMLAVIVSTMMY